MKNWNKTGKIKAIIIVIISIPYLVKPMLFELNYGIGKTIMPFFLGAIGIPIITLLNAKFKSLEIVKPSWNDNPLSMKKPLSSYQFMGYALFFVGLFMMIGSAIKYQQINLLALQLISFGFGVLLGIFMLLKILKK